MRLPTSLSICALATVAAMVSGCRGGDPLDADTAMALLRERNMEAVKFTFNTTPPRPTDDARVVQAYARLIDAHVIECTATEALGKICQPGPAGEALSLVGTTELQLNAGRWVPSTITNISRSGGGNAVAEVHMSFEPSPLYRDFENSFDDIQSLGGKPGVENARNGKTVHATYQRSEDGWHLASVD
jgi:hypothetical protein